MEITYRSVEKYTEARLKAKKANATVNRELELLRRALRLARDRGLLLSLPKISLLPEHNTRQGFFERPELEALVTALPDYLKDHGDAPGLDQVTSLGDLADVIERRYQARLFTRVSGTPFVAQLVFHRDGR
jgi:hypothetical protein